MYAYRKEAPITNITAAGYTDLIDSKVGASAYGYLFDGQLGYLDHGLSSAALTPQVTSATEWHINADEVNLLDYNDTIKDSAEDPFNAKPTATNLYEPNAYRFTSGPLAVTLAGFSAAQQGDAVLLTWETATELNNFGFNLYRGTSQAGPLGQLNETLIPSQSPGDSGGFVYTWEDRAGLMPGTSYYYWVEDVSLSGATTLHGPVSVDYTVPTAVQVSSLQAGSAATQPFAWLWVVAIALLVLGFTLRFMNTHYHTALA